MTDLHDSQEEHLQRLVDALPLALVAVDRAGLIRLVNVQALSLLGYQRSELLERPVSVLLPETLRDQHGAAVERFFQSGRPRRMGVGRELHALRRDGSRLLVEVGLCPLDVAGAALTVASIEDVAERRRVQADRERLAAIVDASEDAILSTTSDGVITSWNRAAERLFRIPRQAALGASFVARLVPTERRAAAYELLRRVASGQAIGAWDTTLVDGAGQEAEVSASLAPLRDERGAVVAVSAIVRDMRAWRARDRELERSNAELEQFASIAAHDLHEPLRAVVSFTQLVAERHKHQLDDTGLRYLQYASDAARWLQQLVGDLLTYARVGSSPQAPTAVSLERVVEQVRTALHEQIAESAATFDIGELPTIAGVWTQLSQLFLNLISNALKSRSDAPPRIVIRASSADDAYQISVSDNGIGFEVPDDDSMFQLFARLHERRGPAGSGLGLAIARRVVERHGGRIWADSAKGHGATFHFTLPRRSPHSPST